MRSQRIVLLALVSVLVIALLAACSGGTVGGTKAPAYETFLTLMRDQRSVRIPLQAVLADPAENVFVRPGDVVSVAREPQTFTSAGATGTNSVVPFDAVGITLDQAIARASSSRLRSRSPRQKSVANSCSAGSACAR